MAHVKSDRVQETSTGTGTGALTLAGAVSKFRAYSAVLSDADTCVCLIEHNSAAEWEVSLCTYASGGNTLTRSTIYASSNGGSLVNFSAGTKTISLVVTSVKNVSMDDSGDAAVTRDLAVGRDISAPNGGVNAAGGSGFRLGSNMIIHGDSIYVKIKDGAGVNNAFVLGNTSDPTNYGNNTSHKFRSRDEVTVFAHINANGLGLGVSPTFKLDIVVADSGVAAQMSGASKGVRITPTSFGTYIKGTAQDGSGAQPLVLDGSQVITEVDFVPGTDNAKTLGGAGNRWSVVYAGTGTINTSGKDAKRFIGEADDAEKRAAARIKTLPRKYKFADSVEAKGDAARWHFGYIAEDVRDALAAEGLDPWAYGFMCSDPIMEREEYTVTSTREKQEEYEERERIVEIVDGKPVLKLKTVTRKRAVGAWLVVKSETGETVMVETGGRDDDDNPILEPMRHFLPETEDFETTASRMVDTGRVRLGLRYSELEAFLRCAD